MTSDLEELEAINNEAIESIGRLESRGSSQSQSFWDADPAKRYRPSQQNVSVPLFENSRRFDDPVPRRYYRPSLSSYETSSYNQMSDSFYRKMLVSVYKNTPKNKENIERPEVDNKVEQMVIEIPQTMSLSVGVFNISLPSTQERQEIYGRQDTTVQYRQPASTRKLPAVSDHTKHQLTAIVMSGALRILTTMVLNWARDREVPYELL